MCHCSSTADAGTYTRNGARRRAENGLVILNMVVSINGIVILNMVNIWLVTVNGLSNGFP